MKLVIVLLGLLVCKSGTAVQKSDSGFFECFNTYNGVRYIEKICDASNSPTSNRKCEKNGDKSEVRVLKYQCNVEFGSLNFPKNTFDDLTRLREVDISSLKVTEVGLLPNQMETIEAFNASHNQLKTGDVPIFDRMPHLLIIDLSFNRIEKILNIHFNKNHELSKLNLSHNAISFLENGAFSHLPKLKDLNLNDNGIRSIPEIFFRENRLLVTLDIRINPIKSFSYEIFSREAGVVKVQLPANKITDLNIVCDKFNCHFEDFTDDERFENIKMLSMSGSKLKNVSTILDRFGRTLERLSLSNSVIGTLSKNMLERFDNLKELTMTRANITTIEFNAFCSQAKLIKLDLSNNELVEVDTTLFCRKFFDLTRLNLEGNRLTRIDAVNSNNVPKLESLLIANNQFSCEYLRKFWDRWHGKDLKFQSTAKLSNERTFIQEIDCINVTHSTTETINNNNDVNVNAVGRVASDAGTNGFGSITSNKSKIPSTLPYTIIIIVLCTIIVAFIGFVVIQYIGQKNGHRKIRSFVKTDIGVQTTEENVHQHPFEPIKANNDPHYEEIEMKCLSSSNCQTDTPPLENRPLPIPPTDDKCIFSDGHISNAPPLPITDQYASVVKNRESKKEF